MKGGTGYEERYWLKGGTGYEGRYWMKGGTGYEGRGQRQATSVGKLSRLCPVRRSQVVPLTKPCVQHACFC